MALRIGQPQAASYPAVLPEEELPVEATVEEASELPVTGQSMDGNAVEWLQEALDLCKSYNCPEDLRYALEQSLIHLIGPSAVEATEPPEMPVEEAPIADGPVEEEV